MVLSPSRAAEQLVQSVWSRILQPLYHEARIAEQVPALEQSAWQRGVVDTRNCANERPILFAFACAPVIGAVGVVASQLQTSSLFWQLVLGAIGAVVGLGLAVGGVLLSYTVRAPYWQRDEARSHIQSAKSLRDLVLLERHLRAQSESNTKTLEEVRKRGLVGPLDEDADPWVRSMNEQLGLYLETSGFGDLVPRVVLSDPEFSTWEEVQKSGWKIARNLSGALESPLFDEVRHLDGLRFPEKASPAEKKKRRTLDGLADFLDQGNELRVKVAGATYKQLDEVAAELDEWGKLVQSFLEKEAPRYVSTFRHETATTPVPSWLPDAFKWWAAWINTRNERIKEIMERVERS